MNFKFRKNKKFISFVLCNFWPQTGQRASTFYYQFGDSTTKPGFKSLEVN